MDFNIHKEEPTDHIRQKRSKLMDVLADTIGLASYEDVQRLTHNEEILLSSEKRLEKEMTNIVDKTNTVIASFTEQSAKLSRSPVITTWEKRRFCGN